MQEQFTTPQDEFSRAVVLEIQNEGVNERGGPAPTPTQTVRVRLTTGKEKGKEVVIEHGADYPITEAQKVKKGEQIVIDTVLDYNKQPHYYISDPYRFPKLLWFLAGFFVLVVLLGRWQGVTAFAGLLVSISVLLFYTVPQIAAGKPPFTVAILSSLVIATLSILLAHRFTSRTYLAVLGTVLTLGLAALLAMFTVRATGLLGLGSEETFYLQQGVLAGVDLRGLLLAGILIGTLGVLDDVTTGQAAVVDELRQANRRLGQWELFRRGLSVGREHITALVNTLALAYAGTSLPLLLLLSVTKTQPLWVSANSEFIADEVVRTLVGSMTLVLAVPITTAIAAWWYGRNVQPAETGE